MGSDINQAFALFLNGVKDLQTTRSINAANEQVSQIKASELSDAEKRQHLQGIAQGLVGNLAGLGQDPARIKLVAENIAPVAHAKTIEQLLTSNDPSDLQRGIQLASFKSNLDQEKYQAEHATAQEIAKTRLSEAQDKQKSSDFARLNKVTNPNEAGARGAVGQLQSRLNKIQELRAELQQPKFTAQNQAALAQGISSVLSGGVGNVASFQELLPHTAVQQAVGVQQYLSGKPEDLNSPEFKNQMASLLDRIEGIAKSQITSAKKMGFKVNKHLAAKYGDEVIDNAEALTGERPQYKGGKLMFPSDAKTDQIKEGLMHLAKNGKDPRGKAIFEQMQQDPQFLEAADDPKVYPVMQKLQKLYYGH